MVVDEYVRALPSAGLRPFVAFYTGYRQAGVAPATHRGLPSPHLTLIFTMDDPVVVAAHPDPRQAGGSYASLLGGLHLTPALITHDGRQSGVQVAVRPLGCRALFGLPASELAFQDVAASAVLPSALVAEVRERLRHAGDWPSRFAAVDAVLSRSVRRDRAVVAPRMAYAWKQLISGLPVASVAGEIGWSGRHLTGRLRAEVGLRPKEVARVARFDRARRALRPGVRLADLAAAHGFADQSHLVREFKALAGCTPSGWLADEFGFVQALRDLPAEDEGHD